MTKFTSLITLTALALGAVSVQAAPMGFVADGKTNSCVENAKSSSDPMKAVISLGRAKNLARQAAEAANGGLGKYRAEDSMHGPISGSPCEDKGGSWTFSFQGMMPGSTTPAYESVVSVDSQTAKVTVEKNTRLGVVPAEAKPKTVK